MLTLALAATLVGFVLLVLGLITGTVWLAVACIAVCLIGLGFLVADVIGSNRRRDGRTVQDMIPSAADEESDRDPPAPATPPQGVPEARAAEIERGSVEDTTRIPAVPPTPAVGDEPRVGTYQDYLRSVGGAPEPVASDPVASDPVASDPVASDPVAPYTDVPDIRESAPQPVPAAPEVWEASEESSGPAVESPESLESPESPSGDDGAAPPATGAPAAAERSSWTDRAAGPGAGSPRKFDPLDPNWRPPLDD